MDSSQVDKSAILLSFIVTFIADIDHITSRKMLLTLLIITLQRFGITSGVFQCVGTCYSGSVYPRYEDTFKGKYVQGHSYKNMTTKDHHMCYRSCIQDCRCKACQMKNDRCELLDADQRFCGMSFAEDQGYVYYDLVQTQYNGKSHLVPDNVCYNGCCKSQPCLNGGKCEDRCQTPKQKFVCHCQYPFTGSLCDKKVSSCFDFIKYSPGKPPLNGKYTIYRSDNGGHLDVFCDFTTPNQAWTLIESFKLAVNSLYKIKAFHDDFPRNINSPPNWHDYRMSFSAMKYVRTKSLLFRATCQFENRLNNSLGPDFLLGDLSDYDVINHGDIETCIRYKIIRIRNNEFTNTKLITSAKSNVWHSHIDGEHCGFNFEGIVVGEEFFGFYNPVNSQFKCTETMSSTTQWWLGEEQKGEC